MSLSVENQGRQFVNAVIPSLKKGISAFNDLTICLLDVDKNFIVAQSDPRLFSDIRSVILSAKQSLREAESAAVKKREMVDKCYENLFVIKENLSKQQESMKGNVQDLKIQQKNNKATLDMYKSSRESAMGHLREARNELWSQRRKMEEAQRLRDAGIGISFIPIFGWIAGPIMIGVSEDDINNARYKVEQAERVANGFEDQIQNFSWRVSDYERRIGQTCSEISKTEDRLRQIAQDIDEVLRQKKEIADFQQRIWNSVKVLGCLTGTSSVVELQTRCFVLLEAVIKLLQNFVKLVEDVREDRLLQDEGIKALITNLQVNYVKMQAITRPPDTLALEEFI